MRGSRLIPILMLGWTGDAVRGFHGYDAAGSSEFAACGSARGDPESAAYFGIEFAVALAIGSVSLFADSIDFLEDASVNLLILVAQGVPTFPFKIHPLGRPTARASSDVY